MKTKLPLPLIAFFALAAGSAGATDRMADTELRIADPRPLAAAADLLESRYGLTVTYEDPPYLWEKDLATYGGAESEVRGRRAAKIPGGTGFTVGWQQVLARTGVPDGSRLLAQDVVAAHAAAAQPGRFRVAGGGTRLHLIPSEVRNAAGTFAPVAPVLDTAVLLAPGRRSALDVANEICAALTAAGPYPVHLGLIPLHDLGERLVEIEPAATPARELLERMSTHGPAPLSWRLYFEPARNRFLLHLHLPTEQEQAIKVIAPAPKFSSPGG